MSIRLIHFHVVLLVQEKFIDTAHLPALLEQHLLGRVLGKPVHDIVTNKLLIPVLPQLVFVEVPIVPFEHLQGRVHLLEPSLDAHEQLKVELPLLLV